MLTSCLAKCYALILYVSKLGRTYSTVKKVAFFLTGSSSWWYSGIIMARKR